MIQRKNCLLKMTLGRIRSKFKKKVLGIVNRIQEDMSLKNEIGNP